VNLEDLCFPCSIVLFIAGFSLLILIVIPETYSWLHLGFYHFVASIILVALSIVLVLLDYFLVWGRPYDYEAPTFLSKESVRTKPVVNKPSPRKHRRKTVNIDPPSREELNKLKEVLSLDVGSLQYKKRGQGIYHVVYAEGKHKWRFIGSWIELKKKLEG
jgi:hypothetical protein